MSDQRYAVIRTSDDACVNVVLWDGDESKWQPPAAHTARLATASDRPVSTITPEEANRTTIQTAAYNALQTNRDFVATASPSAAQTTAQVKALSNQNIRIIRLLLGLLDNTN